MKYPTIIFLVALAVFLLLMMVDAFLLGNSECKGSLSLNSAASCIEAVLDLDEEDQTMP